MQRISRTLGRRDQRPCSLSRGQRAGVTGTHRNPATTPVETLAPAFSQALPYLCGQPVNYNHEVNGEMLFELCSVLVRMEVGTPQMWKECGEDPLAFVQCSVVNRIGKETIELLERNVEYHLEVTDVVGADSADLSTGKLAITIHCSGCGYLKIGPALRALESEEEGLGAAFYWTLIRSLYRVMRIYDHSDAQAYEENLIEYAQEDDTANRDQYEFPEVDKALPECIRRSLKHVSEHWRLDYRRLLWRHRNGRYRNWIRHVEAITKLARVRARSFEPADYDGYYDGPPLPALLIVFEEHDAVAACFDEESQHMLEGSAEPALCAVFTLDNAEQCSAAMRAAERFLLMNRAVCELIEKIRSWEAENEGRGFDRGDASLRAS
jgi:hypothetical protein